MPIEYKIYEEVVGVRKDLREVMEKDAGGWKEAAAAWQEAARLFRDDSVGAALTALERKCDYIYLKSWMPKEGDGRAQFMKVMISGIEFVGRGNDLRACILDVMEQVNGVRLEAAFGG